MRISGGEIFNCGAPWSLHVAFILLFSRVLIIITIDLLLWGLGIVFLQQLRELPLIRNDPQQGLWIMNSVLSEHE